MRGASRAGSRRSGGRCEEGWEEGGWHSQASWQPPDRGSGESPSGSRALLPKCQRRGWRNPSAAGEDAAPAQPVTSLALGQEQTWALAGPNLQRIMTQLVSRTHIVLDTVVNP